MTEFDKIVDTIKGLQKLSEPEKERLEIEIDTVIANKVTDENKLDKLFDELLNIGFILDIKSAYAKLYGYVINIYPDLADNYLDYYNEHHNE